MTIITLQWYWVLDCDWSEEKVLISFQLQLLHYHSCRSQVDWLFFHIVIQIYVKRNKINHNIRWPTFFLWWFGFMVHLHSGWEVAGKGLGGGFWCDENHLQPINSHLPSWIWCKSMSDVPISTEQKPWSFGRVRRRDIIWSLAKVALTKRLVRSPRRTEELGVTGKNVDDGELSDFSHSHSDSCYRYF